MIYFQKIKIKNRILLKHKQSKSQKIQNKSKNILEGKIVTVFTSLSRAHHARVLIAFSFLLIKHMTL